LGRSPTVRPGLAGVRRRPREAQENRKKGHYDDDAEIGERHPIESAGVLWHAQRLPPVTGI
jgi:hypothetical protein